MMERITLNNGIAIVYTSDSTGNVTIEYPDGSEVRTTWNCLSQIESLIEHLRQAYEFMLTRAGADANTPVETLVKIDDLLFALSNSTRSCSPQSAN